MLYRCACTSLCHYSMLFQHFKHLCIELTAIIALEYLRIGERANPVNVCNHVSNVFRLLISGNFVSGSGIDFGENVLVLIPI